MVTAPTLTDEEVRKILVQTLDNKQLIEEFFLFMRNHYTKHINGIEEAGKLIESEYRNKKLSPEVKTIIDIFNVIITLSKSFGETSIIFFHIAEIWGVKSIELNEQLKAITKYFEKHEVELKDFVNKELEKSKNQMLSEDDKKVLVWIKKYFEHRKGEDPDQ